MRVAAALLAVSISSFAVSAIAQTTFVGTRVSRSDYPEPDVMAPLPPLLPGAPVRILFYYPGNGEPPVATVHGDAVEVAQTFYLDPPATGPALYLIDIGPQAEGTYHVLLNRSFVQKGVVLPGGTYPLTYLVQSTPPSSPCSALPLAKVPLVQVSRTESGTVHLHFEEIRNGVAPMWGVPAVVDVRKDAIDIEQTLFDVSAPLRSTCHAEDIDLGELAPGSYTVSWGAVAKFGEQTLVSPNVIGFQWNGLATTCSTTPELSASPGVTLSLRRMTISKLRGPTVAEVKGNVITVVDAVQTAFPPSLSYPTPQCIASSVPVGPLAPGNYTVNWQAAEEALAPEPIGTFHLAIPAPRSRAARH